MGLLAFMVASIVGARRNAGGVKISGPRPNAKALRHGASPLTLTPLLETLYFPKVKDRTLVSNLPGDPPLSSTLSAGETRVVLDNVSWETFERLLDETGPRRGRFAY